jgi:hypothetical protein
MTIFDAKSRYATPPSVLMVDGRGRTVEVIPPSLPQPQALLGRHQRRQGERPDHLAARYLADPTAWWAIGWINDAMTAEVLSELREPAIPVRR